MTNTVFFFFFISNGKHLKQVTTHPILGILGFTLCYCNVCLSDVQN